MSHSTIIQIVIAYTLAGAFVFTVIITCLSLVGLIKFQDSKQQRKLFYVLIVELVVGCLGFFFDFLRFDAFKVQQEIADTAQQEMAERAAILSAQVEKEPPYYGNSQDGNVRPQMEAYIRGFKFPENSKPAQAVTQLLDMIEVRKNTNKPTEYFNADNTFRAKLDTFRSNIRAYIISGKWPED
jgi:hypothetical protein